MDKKPYIIPFIICDHVIMEGALAEVPIYGETGSPTESGGLVKERNEDIEKNDDWGEVSSTIW